MASINKVILVGNLGRDPETRYAPSGDAMCNVSIATTDRWRDKTSGEMKDQTEWHRVVFFGKLAEVAGQYLRKGRQVYIEGSLRTRKWQDKDGQERYTTEIRADVMQMLGAREGMGDAPPMRAPEEGGSDYNSSRPAQSSSNRPPSNPPANTSSSLGDFDDDIPF